MAGFLHCFKCGAKDAPREPHQQVENQDGDPCLPGWSKLRRSNANWIIGEPYALLLCPNCDALLRSFLSVSK